MKLFSNIIRKIQHSSLPSLRHCLHFIRKNFSLKYLIAGGLLLSGICLAQNNGDAEMMQNIISLLNFLFAVITSLMTPAVIMAGWLLSPDWTMGDFFGLRPYFLDVWVLVSNIVYIVFAMMLLYMAVMQIFGGGEAEYAFKQKLPSFLVGILLVPFTWMIVSFTLSFANQAVAAVLSVPMGAISQMQSPTSADKDKGVFHNKVIPRYISKTFFDGTPVKCDTNGQQIGKDGKKTDCMSAAEFLTYNDAGPFFIIMVYAYDIFKIQETDAINLATKECKGKGENGQNFADSKDCVKGLFTVLQKFGTALITTIFFAILLIALCWVLLMRAFKLWIYIMFSPLFGLSYFTGKGFSEALHSEGGGESKGFGQLGFKQFFQLAMVPVLVSAVLSFGLLFIGVIANTLDGQSTEQKTGNTICTTGEFLVQYCFTENPNAAAGSEDKYTSELIIGNDQTNKATRLDGTKDCGGEPCTITFNFGNMLSGAIDSAKTGAGAGAIAGAASGIHSIFAHIILTLIALVIIWMGIKAAVSYDEVTKVAFEPFAKFGESVGNFVQHIPSYVTLPHPAFKALTPGGMEAIAQAINTKVATDKQADAKSLAEMMMPGMVKATGDLQNATGNLEEATRIVADNKSLINAQSAVKPIKETLKNGFDKINSSTTTADDGSGGKLTIPKLKKELEDVKTPEERTTILRENGPLIAEMKKSSNADEKKLANFLSRLSSGGSTTATTKTVTIEGKTSTISGDFSHGFTVTHEGNAFATKDIDKGTVPPLSGSDKTVYDAIQNHIKSPSISDKDAEIKKIFGVTDPTEIDKIKKYFGITP